MEDRDLSTKAPRLDQIRRLIYGDRLDVLERRMEILARNLGAEVAAARTELARRFDPLEERLDGLEAQRMRDLEDLRSVLLDEMNERLELGLERERDRREARHGELTEELDKRTSQVTLDLKAAVSAAISAREGLAASLRAEVERANRAGRRELEQLGQSLRKELTLMQRELASAEELARLFGDLSDKLRGKRPPVDGGPS